jgi:hypothetical protein
MIKESLKFEIEKFGKFPNMGKKSNRFNSIANSNLILAKSQKYNKDHDETNKSN